MKQLSSFDLHFLVQEFKDIVGGKINQISGGSKGSTKDLAIQIYATKKGKLFLIIQEGKYVYLSPEKRELLESDESSETQGFALQLRKKLKNATITTVEQIASERILHITIQKEEQFNLYIELFAKGNIILCDQNNTIIALAEVQKWKDREVKVKEKYQPPLGSNDYKRITAKELEAIVAEGKTSLVKVMATKLGLGGSYAEELCLRSEIDKNKEKISAKEASRIVSLIHEMLAENVKVQIVKDVGMIKDITPFPLEIYRSLTAESTDTFSQAYDVALSSTKKEMLEHKKLKRFDEHLFRVEERIREQREQIATFESEAIENLAKGDTLFSHYQDIATVQEWYRTKRKEKVDFEKLQKELLKNKKIKKFTQKGELSIELGIDQKQT